MNVEILLKELIQHNVKLSVKEDKLLCQLPESGIDSDLLDRLKKHKEEIKEIIQRTKKPRLRRPSILKCQNDASPRQLSYMQQRLWMLDQIEGSAHYNISNALLLEGNLNIDIFQKAFNTIVERHEILRTTYDLDGNGETYQIIQPVKPLPILQEDLSDFSEEEQNKKIKQVQLEDSKLTFDLKKDILLRVKLIQIKNSAFVVLVTMHHIATDGWSIGILIKEFSALYTAYCKGEKNPLPDLEIQYSDYARWQQEWLKDETLEELKNYWSGQLHNLPPVHNLPLDYARPKTRTFKGNKISSKIDTETLNRLKKICDKEGATLFAGLYAAFTVLLGRYSNESDIVVGTPIANREQSEIANLIGFFVNMLVLRNQLSQNISFVQLIRQSRQMLFDAYSHQQMPFDMLVSTLQPERNAGYSALFQIMFVLQNNEKAEIKLPELSLRQMEQPKPFAMYDLSLIVDENDRGLSLSWEYNTDIFNISSIQRMSGHFERLLKSLIQSPQADVIKAGMMSDEEMKQVLVSFNQTAQCYPEDRTIIDLFEEQVKYTPEQVAVKFEDHSYTYTKLDQLSNQLAAYLTDSYAIGANDLIGIQLERSERMPLSIISILKSGAAYVPIGTDYPAERVAYIIKDAKLKVLINEEELARFFSVQDKYSKERLSVKPSPADLAYCIYTSGSTGTPKGVLNQHAGLFNRLVWMKEYLNVTDREVFLQKTPYTFDVSVWELLLPVICGAQLVFAIPGGHKDPFYLQRLIEEKKVTITHFVPSMLNIFLNNLEHAACSSLRHIVCSGEALPAKVVSECKQQLNSRIHNLYGPTEAAIDVTAIDLTNIDTGINGVTIGYPIANTSIYIVNDAMALQPVGIPGELLIGGVQVACGYLNKPQLSEEKFIENPFKKGGRVYRTGDIAKWNNDGSIVYLGRRDSQVKIRGHRIELGEVTTQLLSKPSIKEAVVTVSKKGDLDRELVAYIVSGITEDASTLRKFLVGKIPDYAIPAYFIQLEALPLSANGKIDEKALPDPAIGTLTGNAVYVAPRNEQEQKLIEIFARGLGRNPAEIGIHDNFFDLGANSIKLIRILQEIRNEFNVDIKPVFLFQYTNINDLASVFASNAKEATVEEEAYIPASLSKKDIAIIGLSGRFPQSENIQAFWNNLVAGKELVRHYEPEELKALGVDEKRIKDPNYIRSSVLIGDPENFDYSFFGYTKGEAELMDPQIRLMHEQAWWALEDAGCNPDEYKGKIGVYLSASDNLNWRAHALMHPNSEVGSFMGRRLADKSFISTLVAYNLDLRGPSFYTDTACSSSLTAVHFACRSLLMKECSIALAGGASIITSIEKGYWYEEGMIASRDGHCRAFDKDASGTLFGEGLGVVVLKRLEDAIQDQDHIYAVIRSTAVNNDGKRKVGYTAPSVNGQAECITLAHKIAGIEPESISYIEAHGTGTRIGDAIEIEALNKAFNYNTQHRCAIGTVKSNLGHLDAVAGVVGLIKTALSLKNKTLPPSINFSTPHPDINFGAGPFYVNSELQVWERENQQVLRAGVSSFGIGGTNAHVILEEEPERAALLSKKQHRLLVFSAKTTTALNNYQHKLKDFIGENGTTDLSRLAYTLQMGRKHFQYRDFLVYDGENRICEEQTNRKETYAANTNGRHASKVVFMFSGGGSQYFKMAAQLYAQEPFFSTLMDEGFEKLKARTGRDFKSVMGYTEEEGMDMELINSIQCMLPALFLVEYAIAKLLIKTGIRPDYMIGHSLGEYVAACISGVFSFDDALEVVIKRAALTDTVPEGGMVGVELPEKEVRPYLTDHLSIAAINMQDSCVISGAKEAIRQFIEALTQDNISFTELKISVAAHSSMFDAILDDYRKALQQIKLSPPQIPFVSNLSGKEITAAEATSPEYWVRHLRRTVNFLSGLGCLLEKGTANYIEIGSGGILTSFLKQHPLFQPGNLGVNVLRHPKEVYNDHAYYLQALGKLWKNGVAIDWDAFNNYEKYNKVSAPGYAFDKTGLQVRVDPFRQMMAGGAVWGAHKRNLQESLFFPNWKRSIFPSGSQEPDTPTCYLIFSDTATQLSGIVYKLKTTANTIEVRYGNEYEEALSLFTIDPFKQDHYERLFKNLEDKGIAIDQVIYNWNIISDDDLLMPCIPVTYLCQQLIVNQAQNVKKFTFIAGFGFNVLGNETIDVPLNLAKETVEMIIRNNAAIFSCCLDIDTDGPDDISDSAVLQDIKYNFSDACIAYRNDNRWVRFFDKIKVNDTGRAAALKSNKNYLIVNGTNSIGRILSAHLSEQYNAKIIITGGQQQVESAVKDKGLKHVHYYQGDAADKGTFRQLIDQIEATHGKIAGVIFISNEHEISDLSDLNNLISIQNKKLQPVQNLYAVFKERRLDFVWVPLRLSSEIHRITEHIYADAYTKMFVAQHRKTMRNWHIISWDDVDTARENEQEITRIFEWSLSQGIKSAIVSFQDIDELKKNKPRQEKAPADPENSNTAVSHHYVAPESKLEKELCGLWQPFLVAGKIGVEDNFFELGGNSLKAMTLLKRIQQQYNVQLDLKDFYAKPTVKLLSQEISIATLLKSQNSKKERSTLKI